MADECEKKSNLIYYHEFEFVSGKRSNSRLIYTTEEKQLYRVNRKLVDGSVAYLCRVEKCSVRIYLKNERVFGYSPINEHSHGDQAKDKFNFQIYNEIKKDCMNIDSISNSTNQISAVHGIYDKYIAK